MTYKLLYHYQRLGQFRSNHPAICARIHKQISTGKNYVFGKIYLKDSYNDVLVIGLDLPIGKKEISVDSLFLNGSKVKDFYSGKTFEVFDGKVAIDLEFGIVLLEKI